MSLDGGTDDGDGDGGRLALYRPLCTLREGLIRQSLADFNSRTPGNNGLAVSVLCDYMMSVRFLIQV